jgi:Tfp pilus assembly protein PilE
MAALMAVLFAVYQSYKMYVGRAEQTEPKAMAMAAGH